MVTFPVRLDAFDTKRLQTFRLVARNGSLRLAAARLNQTVPGVSSRIRKLEHDLGIELFEHLPNKLVLTEKGERFLVEVEDLLARCEQMLASLIAPDELVGRLIVSIGGDHSWYFAPRLSRFLQAYPRVDLSLQIMNSVDALRALGRAEVDVAMGVFPSIPRGLDREVVTESSIALVCPVGHPLLRRQPPSLPDIARHRLIMLPKHAETRKLVDRGLARAGAAPKSVIEVASCRIAGTFVAQGVGVAIVHSLCVEHERTEGLRWVDLGQHFSSVAFSVAYRRGPARSAVIAALIEELKR